MSVLQLSRRAQSANRAPDRYTLDRSCPQAKSLRGWWPMVGDSGFGRGRLTAVDFIKDNDAVPDDSTPNMTIGPRAFPGAELMYFPRTDTVNDMLRVPNDPSYMAVGDSTWTCWVRFEDASQLRYGVLGRSVGFSTGKGLYWENGTERVFQAYMGGWNNGPKSTTQLEFGDWHHVAFTVDDFALDGWLYIDGLLAGTDTTMAWDQRGTDDFCIGAIGYGTDPGVNRVMQGHVFDVRWYDRILSAGEIWNIYKPDTRWDLFKPVRKKYFFPISITCALSGSAADSIDEDDITTGGEEIILTLTGDTWVNN